MKRFLAAVLILLMLIPPMMVSAEGEPSFTILGAEGRKGDTVQVVVAGENLPDCASLDLILQYDTAVLKPTALAKGDLSGMYFDNKAYPIRESDGIGKVGEPAIKICAGTTSITKPLLSGNPTLVTITFELLADPGPAGAKVEVVSYLLSKMDADLTKITGIALPTGYVTCTREAISCSVTAPNKTTYYSGDALDLEGGSIWVSYANGDQEQVLLSDLPEDAIGSIDQMEFGTQEIPVTYAGLTGSFQIELLPLMPTDLEVTKQPTKTSYVVGQQFDLSGGELTLSYNSGAKEIVPMTNDLIDTSVEYELREGWCMIPLIYKGRTATVNIYFEARAAVSLMLLHSPQKTTYIEGQALDLTGGIFRVTYNDDSAEDVYMTDPLVRVSGYDPNLIGDQTLTITYKEQQAELLITVIKRAVEIITVKTEPSKTTFVAGQPFDFAGGELTAIYNDGSSEEIPFSDSGVSASGYDPTAIGEQTIEITYEGKTAQYTIRVIPKAEELIELISAPNKKIYIQGEPLDLTGGKIRIYYNNGEQKERAISAEMISGYQAEVAGEQTLSVTVGGKSTTFSIKVLSLEEAPTVSFSGGSGIAGSTVTLDLSVLRAPVSGGFQLEFSYDPSMLEPIAWSDGLADNAVPNEDALGAEAGVLKLAGLYMESFEGDQTLGSITFRLLQTGETEIEFKGGFFTSETFGSAPVFSVTAVGENKTLHIQPKAVEKVQLTLSGYAMGNAAEGLRLSAVEGVRPHSVYGEHYALLNVDGVVRGAIKGGVNYTFGIILVPQENYTLTELSAKNITLNGKAPSRIETLNGEILVYFDLDTLLIKNPFKDVKSTDWYSKSVLWAVSRGITNGTTATSFSPQMKCDRGQVVTFLWNAAGRPEPQSNRNPFTDVKSTDYYYKAVLWAVENGITNGTAPGKFGPQMTCDRAQIVTFLWNAAGKPQPTSATNPFKDVQSTDWYSKAVLWAVEEGITNGTAPGKFSPTTTCDRGQIVTFLYNLYKNERFEPDGGLVE